MKHKSLSLIFNAIGHGYKRTAYNYYLISGKVNRADYQLGQPDRFTNRYAYDADNRILSAHTTRDGVIWEEDADYNYYKHGPLARMQMGERDVQGLDYVYTIQGWLKSVNSITLSETRDPGRDANNVSGNTNRFNGRDIFGFSLEYFNGDFQPIAWGAGGTLTAANHYLSDATAHLATGSLYNGNIAMIQQQVRNTGNPLLCKYDYDQLNRLANVNLFSGLDSAANSWASATATDDYHEAFTYDANGNILTLLRNGLASQALAMDTFTCRYTTGTKVYDLVNNTTTTLSGAEYVANAVRGNDNKIYIVKKSGTATSNVLRAIERDASTGLISSADVGIGIDVNPPGFAGMSPVKLGYSLPAEIYTKRELENKNYEITDHLGNVRTVITDRLAATDNSGTLAYAADVTSHTDYYPFGMLMPQREFQAGYRYSINGQEKTDEISGAGNHTTALYWEYNTRLGRRWNTDPKPNPSISIYACFNNNPIWGTDVLGDSSVFSNKGDKLHYDPKDKDLRVFMKDGDKLTQIGELGKKVDVNKILGNVLKDNKAEAKKISPYQWYKNVKFNGKWDYKDVSIR